ncbi:MAG: sialate O-acetylesterase [Planctomycetaceae bacterium]|nr:sialate O-acetylesterase [Planctomycetaceae bacterium]
MTLRHSLAVLAAVVTVGGGSLSVQAKPRKAPPAPPALPAAGVLHLPAVIGSNMVLQRDVPLPIWGWAGAGHKVTVKLGGVEKTATADDKGKWTLTLPAQKSGGEALTMTVSAPPAPGTDKPQVIELTNILVGEVWLASGQSNMEWGVAGSRDAAKEIAAAKLPRIRLFNVPKVQTGAPSHDVAAQWVECSPESVRGFSAVAFFFGRVINKELDVPVALINASWGGSPIQPWTPPAGYELVPRFKTVKVQPGPATMFNGMVAPLAPFAIRGALWYQGETNCIQNDGLFYTERMKALVLGWRKVWNQGDFPFYSVQIAPWAGYKPSLPTFWQAQLDSVRLIPNTGLAQTTDLVADVGNIHPVDKVDVGARLARLALKGAYGRKDVVTSGPTFKAMTVKNGKAVVTFDGVAGGLASKDDKELACFEIAGADKKFVPAKATIEGNTVVVSAAEVPVPVAVRMSWSNTARPNLVSQEGLPAWPFRTDDWE